MFGYPIKTMSNQCTSNKTDNKRDCAATAISSIPNTREDDAYDASHPAAAGNWCTPEVRAIVHQEEAIGLTCSERFAA